MKEYVLAVCGKKDILLDLNEIKKLHSYYIQELNEELFSYQLSVFTETPEQITEALFKSEDYVIQWIEHYLSWKALKPLMRPVRISYRKWKKAEKKVVSN